MVYFMSKIVSNIKTNYESKKNAFAYQAMAFEFLKDLNYSAIFHEQGLGKTKIAIDLALYWLNKRQIDTVLIVTKKQLIQNWYNEFLLHSFIKPRVLSNKKNENYYIFNGASKVILTNFETISVEKERISLFLRARDVAIIVDESVKLKNPDSKITGDFLDLSGLFKIKTIMTGTPVANRPYDIWSQIYFLDNGKSLGNDFKDFKKRTNLSNDLADNVIVRKKFETSVSKIFEKINSFSVRETKDRCGISLPQKIYKCIHCEFELFQKKLYDSVLLYLKAELSKDNKLFIDDERSVLKRLLRLTEIVSNPRIVNDQYSEISGKEKKLDYLINKILENNEKCIIWSCFIENIEYLTKKYSCFGSLKIHGKMSIDARNRSVNLFKQESGYRILFATPQAAKEGLTLTVANHVIFYDRGFNLDDYLQAQDRIHRISQTKTCYVYNLIMEDSVDEWIDALLDAKHYAALLAQGDIKSDIYSKYVDYSYCDIMREILEAGEMKNV